MFPFFDVILAFMTYNFLDVHIGESFKSLSEPLRVLLEDKLIAVIGAERDQVAVTVR